MIETYCSFDKEEYAIANPEDIITPALLAYPEKIEENIRRMKALLGGSFSRLRPHIKTVKTSEIVSMLLAAGIEKLKVATLDEARLAVECGAKDVMIAYPLLGHQARQAVEYYASLHQSPLPLPRMVFQLSGLENAAALDKAVKATGLEGLRLDVLIDLDMMGRTGIPAAEAAHAAVIISSQYPSLRVCGIHAYEGHRHPVTLDEERSMAKYDYGTVEHVAREFEKKGIPLEEIVTSGSPTFRSMHEIFSTSAYAPVHSVSPGIWVLWDASSNSGGRVFPPASTSRLFTYAAMHLSRVVNVHGARTTLDIGHKRVGKDKGPLMEISVTGLEFAFDSEEHTVYDVLTESFRRAPRLRPGDFVYAVPNHVCPDVDKHDVLHVIEKGRYNGVQWQVVARSR
ncbi:alanine racemase [Candidatus Woesearchaeota archaeon]|nr:alanine racemase [Candidatus Woesearchaeota archaeon]